MRCRGRIGGTVAIIYAFNTIQQVELNARGVCTHLILARLGSPQSLFHVAAHYTAANLVCQVLFLDYTQKSL